MELGRHNYPESAFLKAQTQGQLLREQHPLVFGIYIPKPRQSTAVPNSKQNYPSDSHHAINGQDWTFTSDPFSCSTLPHSSHHIKYCSVQGKLTHSISLQRSCRLAFRVASAAAPRGLSYHERLDIIDEVSGNCIH